MPRKSETSTEPVEVYIAGIVGVGWMREPEPAVVRVRAVPTPTRYRIIDWADLDGSDHGPEVCKYRKTIPRAEMSETRDEALSKLRASLEQDRNRAMQKVMTLTRRMETLTRRMEMVAAMHVGGA